MSRLIKDKNGFSCNKCIFFEGKTFGIDPKIMAGDCLLLDKRIGVSIDKINPSLPDKYKDGNKYYKIDTLWDECPTHRRDTILRKMEKEQRRAQRLP